MLICKYPASYISLCRGNVVILCVSAYSQPRCRNQGSRDKSANQATQIRHMMALVSSLLNSTKYTWSANFLTLSTFFSVYYFPFLLAESLSNPTWISYESAGVASRIHHFQIDIFTNPYSQSVGRPLIKLGYQEGEAWGRVWPELVGGPRPDPLVKSTKYFTFLKYVSPCAKQPLHVHVKNI